MSTGIENWLGTMTEVGALYPFVGSEKLWLIACVALWIIWHIWQARIEKKQFEDEVRRYGDAESLRKLIRKEDPENP